MGDSYAAYGTLALLYQTLPVPIKIAILNKTLTIWHLTTKKILP